MSTKTSPPTGKRGPGRPKKTQTSSTKDDAESKPNGSTARKPNLTKSTGAKSNGPKLRSRGKYSPKSQPTPPAIRTTLPPLPPSPTESVGDPIPPPDSLSATVASGLGSAMQAAHNGPLNATNIQPRGFTNTRVMCYRNSLITALFHTSTFMGYLQRHHIPHEFVSVYHYGSSLLAQMNTLANIYRDSNSTRNDLNRDMTKFFTLLCTQEMPSMWIPGDSSGGRRHEQKDIEEFFLNILFNVDHLFGAHQDHRDIFKKMHQITLSTRRQCGYPHDKDVRQRSRALDPNYTWSLAMPAPHIDMHDNDDDETIEDVIAFNMKMPEDWACNECERKRVERKEIVKAGETFRSQGIDMPIHPDPYDGEIPRGIVWYNIHHAPETLFIQLKRFAPNSFQTAEPESQKTTREIVFGEKLDLSRWLEKALYPAGAQARYRLDAVVSHVGGLDGGHYISDVRDAAGRWWRLNNEYTTASSIERVNDGEFTPYLAMYSRYPEDLAANKAAAAKAAATEGTKKVGTTTGKANGGTKVREDENGESTDGNESWSEDGSENGKSGNTDDGIKGESPNPDPGPDRSPTTSLTNPGKDNIKSKSRSKSKSKSPTPPVTTSTTTTATTTTTTKHKTPNTAKRSRKDGESEDEDEPKVKKEKPKTKKVKAKIIVIDADDLPEVEELLKGFTGRYEVDSS